MYETTVQIYQNTVSARVSLFNVISMLYQLSTLMKYSWLDH